MSTACPNTPAGYTAHPTNYVLYDSALLIGRILLAAMFVYSGAGKFMDLDGTAAQIGAKGLPMPFSLATLAAAAEAVGGLAIVLGVQTRLVAAGLIVFTAIASYFFHDFWTMPEGPERLSNIIHFMKNVSVCGGFLLLVGAGAGRYSIDGRPK